MKNLQYLQTLKTLWIHDTSVTDKGIAAVATLRHLEVLELPNTHVSRTAYEQLKRSLPNTEIIYYPLIDL